VIPGGKKFQYVIPEEQYYSSSEPVTDEEDEL